MVMCKEDARGFANEALRVIATNPDFSDLKDLIARELDVTDEVLDEAVEVLFSKPEIVLDAHKYAVWVNGSHPYSKGLSDSCEKIKTLWDIPHTYLPRYVFVSGFEIAKERLPSDGCNVLISDQAAKELYITWINVPEAAS